MRGAPKYAGPGQLSAGPEVPWREIRGECVQLFDLDVVPGEHRALARSDQDRGGIGSDTQHDSLAQDVARQIGRFVRLGRRAESKKLVPRVLHGIHGLAVVALIAEDAEIVADLDALGAAQIHIDSRPLAGYLPG